MIGIPRVSVGYAMPAAAAAQLDPLPALTLVHAPRGWGKSSLIASRLSPEGSHDGPVLWVALGEEELTGADFRRHLDALLAHAADRPERPTLVLDNIASLAPDATPVILEVAEAWDGPNLVLISRDSAPLASLAPLAPDSVIITGQHLRIDAARTMAIGARMGVSIDEEQAQVIVDDFAGWPGLVRGALFGQVTGGEGAANYDVLTRLSAHVMTDFSAMTSGGYAGLLLPERIENWVTDELFGGLDASFVVRRVEGLGVVRPDHGGYVFAPGIRRIGLRAFREAHPDHLQALAARLQARARKEGDVRAEMLLAAEAEDWAAVREVVHAGWEHLALAAPAALHEVATRVPDAQVAGDARLLAARHLLSADHPPGWMFEFMSARILAEPPAPTMGPLPPAGRGGIDAQEWRRTLSLLAVARLRAADGVTAAVAAHQALRYRPGPDEEVPTWAREEAVAASLMLALTLVGSTSDALRWMHRYPEPSADPGAAAAGGEDPGRTEATEAVSVAGELARVADAIDLLGEIVAGERSAGAATVERLRAMLDVTVDPGLQGGLLLVLTGIALVRGEAASMLLEVERRAIVARSSPQIPVARVLMHACAADLCLALGHTTSARSWLDSATATGSSSVLVEPASIRLLLADGDEAEVLRRTESVAATVAPRYAIELWLGRAVAAHRTGLLYVQSEAIERAAALAVEHGIVRPFVMLPKDASAAILERARPLLGELAVPLLSTHPGVFPAPDGQVRLTARESEVLGELARGTTVPGIARKYVVAPSTIRTHTSALYRKLGVTTRAAAIERAERLGLL